MTYAVGKVVAVITAAGNDGVPLCAEPAFDAGVMCVAATDEREGPSAYSSGTIKPDLMAVSAPGATVAPTTTKARGKKR